MSDTDRWEREMRQIFGAMFPLVAERDLPYWPSHIPGFLKQRIDSEIRQQTQQFTTAVVKVLCEVTRPTHVEDMARAVVKRLQVLERLRERLLADAQVNLERHEKGEKILEPHVLKYFQSHLEQIKNAGPRE